MRILAWVYVTCAVAWYAYPVWLPLWYGGSVGGFVRLVPVQAAASVCVMVLLPLYVVRLLGGKRLQWVLWALVAVDVCFLLDRGAGTVGLLLQTLTLWTAWSAPQSNRERKGRS
jgi:hypothetical protein